MLLDGSLLSTGIEDVSTVAREHERRGYTGLWSSEAGHDPFLPLLTAASHTETLQVGTAIAVAFARSPMQTAYLANDLQLYSKGRFVLGLGTQVKAHIERRFNMPWGKPVARMREYLAALRAIWASWQDGSKLSFRGEYYQHTLMTPFFSPGPNRYGPPPVVLAAVGPAMTRLAGEAADGLLVHGFTTRRYLTERTLPALTEGLAAGGRSRSDVTVSYPGIVVTGRTGKEMETATQAVRGLIAFYGSTPTYRPVLELHGWGGLADELHQLSTSRREDRWQAMAGLIGDEVVREFAVVAEPGRLAAAVLDRWGGLIDRFSTYTPYATDLDLWEPLVDGLRRAG